MELTNFERLLQKDVNEYVEQRTDGNTTLSYLSWAFAWSEFKKEYPDATYEIMKYRTFTNSAEVVPYMFDEETGYMVNTKITAGGLTYEMWLPVMDSRNKAMKNKPYTYKTKRGEFTVEPATMFDINKTIMRCLVKNMAMFGLGLYIYAGEDLPENMGTTETMEEFKINTVKAVKEKIENATTDDELTSIYRTYKKVICENKDLLDCITKKGNKLSKKG